MSRRRNRRSRREEEKLVSAAAAAQTGLAGTKVADCGDYSDGQTCVAEATLDRGRPEKIRQTYGLVLAGNWILLDSVMALRLVGTRLANLYICRFH